MARWVSGSHPVVARWHRHLRSQRHQRVLEGGVERATRLVAIADELLTQRRTQRRARAVPIAAIAQLRAEIGPLGEFGCGAEADAVSAGKEGGALRVGGLGEFEVGDTGGETL